MVVMGNSGTSPYIRKFGSGDGCPDGMTINAQGNLRVVIWDGWRIKKLNEQGQTVGVIKFPISGVTSCSFAGDDEHRIFATTASLGAHRDEQPLAGALFPIDSLSNLR